MMLDVAQRYSSMAESSSNIENVISVGVGGSGASDTVAFVELLGGPGGHICMLDAPLTQKMITRSSSSACSMMTCCTSSTTDRSSPPSPRPPARSLDAHISNTGTPAHAQPTRAPPRLLTLRPLPGAGARCLSSFLSKELNDPQDGLAEGRRRRRRRHEGDAPQRAAAEPVVGTWLAVLRPAGPV